MGCKANHCNKTFFKLLLPNDELVKKAVFQTKGRTY